MHGINYSDKSEWKITGFNPKQYKKSVYNHKSILCQNIISRKTCDYAERCLYAHSLDEQKIILARQQPYDIILNDFRLDHINLKENQLLYRELQLLSNMCFKCARNTCTGGFNCKNGACKAEYVICINDLEGTECRSIICKKIHLTRRGLKPIQKDYDNQLSLSTLHSTDALTGPTEAASDQDEVLLHRSIFD